MRRRKFQLLLAAVLAGGLVGAAWSAGEERPATRAPAAKPAQPARNLQVELRQVSAAGGGYTASSAAGAGLLAPQQVLVRNGEQATLQFGQLVPLQWVSAAQRQQGSLSVGGGSAAGSAGGSVSASLHGGAVQQELQWMPAGQALRVRPRWSGGAAPVMLEVDVQVAVLEPSTGVAGSAHLPTQTRSQWATTVSAPLGEWVTIARSGAAATARGVYGSEVAAQPSRLLQLRVLAP